MARAVRDRGITTWTSLCALAVLALSSHARGQTPCSYEISHVIQGPGCGFGIFRPTEAYAISPSGRYVVGNWQQCEVGFRAFLYDTTTSQFMLLPLPAGFVSSTAWDVNDSGLAVGNLLGTGVSRGFVFDASTSQYTTLLAPLVSNGACEIMAINAAGVVCGYRTIAGAPDYPFSAFFWTAENGIVDLGVLIEPGSVGLDINASSTMVGYAGVLVSPSQRGLIHATGITTILPPIPDGIYSTVSRINDLGMMLISGATQLQPQEVGHVYLVDADSWTVLPPLHGFQRRSVGDLSNDGTVVGRSHEPFPRATVWHQGQPQNLNELIPPNSGFTLEFARGIADTGAIVVHAKNLQFDTVTVVLTPVPPSPGDSNCDERVNIDDLLEVINHWGPCAGCAADLNGDHSVNVQDLMLVITNWTFTK